MDEHDAIVAAFQAVASQRGDTIACCDRSGWTHIHGPSQPPSPGATRCANHLLDIQKYNGSVNFGQALSERLGGQERPNEPITQHPLGFSHQNLSVMHPYGLTAPEIRRRWGTYSSFADEVVAACVQLGIW